MFRGRYQLGDELPLLVLCVDANGLLVAPLECPTCDVWSSVAKVQSFQLPVMDGAAVTGLFGKRLFLGATYAAGLYRAVYRWRTSGFNGMREDPFEIVAGGDPDGAVIALQEFVRPPSRYFVQQRDSGKIVRGKNPRF